MQFHWTEEEISALRQKAYPHGASGYVRQHLGYLEVHLKRHRGLKSPTHMTKAWQDVEYEARKVEEWIGVLENPNNSGLFTG